MSFLAALLVLVHALLAGAFATPATPTPAHGVTVSPVPAPAAVAPAAGRVTPPAVGRRLPPAPTPATVAPAPPLDPAYPDYAPQGPGEVIGRQIDCPDGTVGVMDAAGAVSCPGPAPSGP